MDLGLSLRCWNRHGWAKVEEVERAVNAFAAKLYGSDLENYPGKFKVALGQTWTLPGSIAQMRTLVKYLPIALLYYLEKSEDFQNHPSWQIVLTMAELSRRLSSFAMTESQVVCIEQVYLKYLENRFAMCEEMKEFEGNGLTDKMKLLKFGLKPKHVTVFHYHRLIRRLGPLAFYSTLLGERRNGFFKQHSKRSHNYKNIVKTLADFVEGTESVERRRQKRTDEQDVQEKKMNLDDLQEEVMDLLQEEDLEKTPCARVLCQGTEYSKGSVISYYENNDGENSTYNLGLVKVVLLAEEESLTFLVEPLTKKWNSVYQCWQVENNHMIVRVPMHLLASAETSIVVATNSPLGAVVCLSQQPTLCE